MRRTISGARFRTIRIGQLALAVTIFGLLLAACGGQPTPPPTSISNILTWDKDPKTIIFRADREPLKASKQVQLNHVPLCTVYGNGHVVWVNVVPPNGEEILEAFIDDVTMRGFLEFLIRDVRYYSIPDYAAREQPNDLTTSVESATLNLAGTPQTVRSYSAWENDAFTQMTSRCAFLSSTPGRFEPEAGWVTAFALAGNNGAPSLFWSPVAEVTLKAAASSGQPIWVRSALAAQIWNAQRELRGNVIWLEGESYYQLSIQVPGITLESPPAPAE